MLFVFLLLGGTALAVALLTYLSGGSDVRSHDSYNDTQVEAIRRARTGGADDRRRHRS